MTTTRAHFDDAAEGYYHRNYEAPRTRHARALALRRSVCLDLVPPVGDRVLDLGCGPGAMSVPLAVAGRSVVAFDLAPRMVEEARRLIERLAPGARAEFCVGDAQALPFDAARFDVVVTTGVLEYIPDVERALSEVARVLRPGGVLVASVSLPRTLERTVVGAIGRLRGRETPFHRAFTADQLDAAVARAGFEVDARRFSYFAPFPLDVVWPPLVTLLDRFSGTLAKIEAARDAAKTYVVRAYRL